MRKGKLRKRICALGLALCMSVTAIAPDIAYAADISLWVISELLAPTWSEERVQKANDYYLQKVQDVDNSIKSVATGMAFNRNYWSAYMTESFQSTGVAPASIKNWPLEGILYLEPVDGYDNSEYKDFEFIHLFCTANHERASHIYNGSRAFCSGIYQIGKKMFDAASKDKTNPEFNFIMLALACNYPNHGEKIPKNSTSMANDLTAREAVVCQAIAWMCTDTASPGFKGDWATDLNNFMSSVYWLALLCSFPDSDPDIHSWLTSAPDPNSEAAQSGLGLYNNILAVFYDVWTAAMLTGQLKQDYDKDMSYAGTAINDGVATDGMYHATMTINITSNTSQKLSNMKFTPYGDWQLKSVQTIGNQIVWDFISSTAQTDENGCIGSFSGAGDLGVAVPTDMTKAKLYTFDTWNVSVKENGQVGAWERTQTQFASIIEGTEQLCVKYGEASDDGGGGGGGGGGEESDSSYTITINRYKHSETWQANYNINLYKFDSETGNPIQGSEWNILEMFDDSQLSESSLDDTDSPGKAALDESTKELNSTDVGDDEVSSNYSGSTALLDIAANKYNWANDSGSQFKRWGRDEAVQCGAQYMVTDETGQLRQADSGDNLTGNAHTDTKSYTYTKGYCGGHPAPDITYAEVEEVDEENAEAQQDQVDEENEKIHREAWEAWLKEVKKCEQLAKEGGFFHAVDADVAKAAMEADRDQFYKDFISLTYDYSAQEIKAAPGYILHGTHTDDIPIEWRTVTSSEYKATDQATNIGHGASGGSSAEDGGDEEEEESLEGSLKGVADLIEDDSASYIAPASIDESEIVTFAVGTDGSVAVTEEKPVAEETTAAQTTAAETTATETAAAETTAAEQTVSEGAAETQSQAEETASAADINASGEETTVQIVPETEAFESSEKTESAEAVTEEATKSGGLLNSIAGFFGIKDETVKESENTESSEKTDGKESSAAGEVSNISADEPAANALSLGSGNEAVKETVSVDNAETEGKKEETQAGIQAVKEEEKAETEEQSEEKKEDGGSDTGSNSLGAVSGDNSGSGADGSESVSFGAGANAANESAGGQTDDTKTTDTTTETTGTNGTTTDDSLLYDEDGVLLDGDVLDDGAVTLATPSEEKRPETEVTTTGFLETALEKGYSFMMGALSSISNAVMSIGLDEGDEEEGDDEGGEGKSSSGGAGCVRNIGGVTLLESDAAKITAPDSTIIDWTFIVYDHRTEGEIHFNKRDFDLSNDGSDKFDTYAQENGDGTLEGAVYGLFAADKITHPDVGTGVVYEKGDLVAIATTDRNGDASFMVYTEAPGTTYDYETGTTKHTGSDGPKNLHVPQSKSADVKDIENFVGHKPDNSEITAGNGNDLVDTSDGTDSTFFYKYSSNQGYEDTYREDATSGHYPISDNETNNGNCWIGRPLIVGTQSADYYIKELSRSEGYELSVSGKNDELTTNKAAFDKGGDVVEGKGTANLVSGSLMYARSGDGTLFRMQSNGTDNGYVITMDNVPAGATLNFTSSVMVEDYSVSHKESKNVSVDVYADKDTPVSLDGHYWEASQGQEITYNGRTFTVNNTYTVEMGDRPVTPTNVTVIKNPFLDTSKITVSENVQGNINAMLALNNFTKPVDGSPWQLVPITAVAGDKPATQEVADAINTQIFGSDALGGSSNAHGIFNAFRMVDMYEEGGVWYAVLSYSCKDIDGKTCDSAYDETTGKIYVKTTADYGTGVSNGYIYYVVDLSECTEYTTNTSGFVTWAKVPNKYATGSATYRHGNLYGQIGFAEQKSITYWAYAEGEKLLNSDGSVATKIEEQLVDVTPTRVPKTVNTPIAADSYTKTSTSLGYEVGTYVVTIDQASVNAHADEYGVIQYRITFDGDDTLGKSIVAESANISAKMPVITNGSYIQYVTLKYPGQDTVSDDAKTAAAPIDVYERPIRQQVKISKDTQTLPETLEVWYCANDGVENASTSTTCAGCGRERTVEEIKTIDYAHDTYTAFFNEDLSETKQETTWLTRLKTWLKSITGVTGSEDSAGEVANFRFKSYLKSNLERLYRDEDGKVTWLDRNGNEVTPVYVDSDNDGVYETFTWTTYAGEEDFPEIDKTNTEGGIASANVQKIYTKVEHDTGSRTAGARNNNVWTNYADPDTSNLTQELSERNSYYSTIEEGSIAAVDTNMSLYSYRDDCTNVDKSDRIKEEQNAGYTRILEMTESTMEDGAGGTREVFTYNYEKFFDAVSAANTDKWDSGDVNACTFDYNAYTTDVGNISMQAYPGQKWEDTTKPENQKDDKDDSFDVFGWIHEKIYGSVDDYQQYGGTLDGTNVETTTSTSEYAQANAQASNAVRQFAVKWYLKDEVAKLVEDNGAGDGENIAIPASKGGAPGVTDDGAVPYDDYIHDYALYKALEKAYNYLRPFYENDLDTIYSVEWDSAAGGGNDEDTTTLSVDIHEEGAFYNTSAYLPYGVYVVVEQMPSNFSEKTGYDLINRAFDIEKPKEVLVPSVYAGGNSGDTTDDYDPNYTFDTAMTPNQLAASKHGENAGYLIRFNEEWPQDVFGTDNFSTGSNEYVIRAHSYNGDFEVYKYGLDLAKANSSTIKDEAGNDYHIHGFTLTQSEFDPLKDYYAVGHAGESKDGTMTDITDKEGGSGTEAERYKSVEKIAMNTEQTANGSAKYDTEALAKRFFYAAVSESNGTEADNVMYKGTEKDDNNVSGMYFKDKVGSVTGQLTAYEGKYAQMLVAWTMNAPADVTVYNNEAFTGYADVNERNSFKAATLTIRKVDTETGEPLTFDESIFGLYAASRYSTDEEILADAQKITDDGERAKFINQFKPGDTKFFMEDTKIYGSKEFLEAMGAYDISYVLTLSKDKAERYGGNGYVRMTESEVKALLGAKGYTRVTGTVEYGIYNYDALSGTSIPSSETVTWYYSVYNTESQLCVGTVPKGTPVCSEKNAVILKDDIGKRTGMLKAYSTINDVLMEDEDGSGNTSYHLQNTGYMRTPQPLGSGCYVLLELKAPYGYLRSKPEAHEIYSGVDYYYVHGDMYNKVAMVNYAKPINEAYSY